MIKTIILLAVLAGGFAFLFAGIIGAFLGWVTVGSACAISLIGGLLVGWVWDEVKGGEG